MEVLDVAHVRALEVFRSPEPSRVLNEFPPRIRFVVDAVVKEAYVVVEYANVWLAVHEFPFAMFSEKAFPEYDNPAPAVVVAELNLL